MSQANRTPQFSFEEFLLQEEQAPHKSEYFHGEVFAISGGTPQHSLIAMNIGGELRSAIKGTDCLVYNSDLLIRLEEADAGFYPDVSVVCGSPETTSEKQLALTNPTVIVEVLSDSTASWDRGGKFRQYQSIPSLQEYILVEQNEPHIDVYRRMENGFWFLQ
ncbi:MAG: Uma2 family endonuclease, partial [Bacteroidota bacterium]